MDDARPKRVTSKDVARAAGVSRATVSYILNETPHQTIPESTRRRVLEAAAQLDYTPLAAARNLRRGRSEVVILVLPDWPIGPTINAITERIAEHLRAHGLTLVTHAHLADRPLQDLLRAITPAAIIRFGDLGPKDDEVLRRAGVGTLVTLGDNEDAVGGMAFPLQQMGRLQAECLVTAGRRTLGYATPDDDRLSGFRDNRLRGAREACDALGLPPPMERRVGLDVDSAAAALREWRELGVTGVCAYNDESAIALLAGARRLGLRVPADIAIVGADDIPMAPLVDPPLTTVAVDTTRMAEVLAANVVSGLAGHATTQHIPADIVGLVVRGSVHP